MSRNYLFVVLIGLALLTSACGRQGHTHDDPAEERPTVAVTHWTDKTELFMEYPVFVVGQKGRSAIHVTDLKDFSPLSVGEAVVAMKSEDGKEYEFRGGPSRPGIFGVDLSVARAGEAARRGASASFPQIRRGRGPVGLDGGSIAGGASALQPLRGVEPIGRRAVA